MPSSATKKGGFKKAATTRTARQEVRLFNHEKTRIEQLAALHGRDVSEYMRRKALGHRIDIRHDVLMIMSLREVAAAIQSLGATYLSAGLPIPEDLLVGILKDCRETMKRVEPR